MDVFIWDRSGNSQRLGGLEGIALSDCELLWVDVQDAAEADMEYIREYFSLHPLAVDVVGELQPVPRLQEFSDHLLVVWEFPRDDPSTEVIEAAALYMVLGRNFLLTLHREALPEIGNIFDKVGRETIASHRHPAFVLYMLMDESVDQLYPLVESLKEDIDAYMDELLTGGGGGDLEKMMKYRHRNIALRRTVSALREVVARLSRRGLELIPDGLVVYLMDVFDHLNRLYVETDNNSDLISSLLDIRLNVISNRLNMTMKRLTAIATFFMPATFLAGVYGMNFVHMPEIHWYYGYLLFWMIIIVVTLVMLFIARRQEWL